MNIQFHGKHIALGNALQQYMNDALLPALGKYVSDTHLQDISVHVAKQGREFSIAIDAYIVKQKLTATAYGGDAHGAFDTALTKLTKQVRRHKRQLKNHTMPENSRPKVAGAFMATV